MGRRDVPDRLLYCVLCVLCVLCTVYCVLCGGLNLNGGLLRYIATC